MNDAIFGATDPARHLSSDALVQTDDGAVVVLTDALRRQNPADAAFTRTTSGAGRAMTGERVVLVVSRFDEWAARYEALRERIAATLGGVPIEHIGSTSVPGLPAKDVIDALIGVPAGGVEATVARLVADGFDLEGERDGHAWLSLPNRDARAAVVYVVIDGSRQWRDRVDFRDLLRRSSEARDRYLAVKEHAAARATGWGDYTASKAEVVTELLTVYRTRWAPRMRRCDPSLDQGHARLHRVGDTER